MKLGIVKETWPGERRVAASPAVVAKWVKGGWLVQVERGAGAEASYPDAQYEAKGRGKQYKAWIGYKVQVAETLSEENRPAFVVSIVTREGHSGR